MHFMKPFTEPQFAFNRWRGSGCNQEKNAGCFVSTILKKFLQLGLKIDGLLGTCETDLEIRKLEYFQIIDYSEFSHYTLLDNKSKIYKKC